MNSVAVEFTGIPRDPAKPSFSLTVRADSRGFYACFKRDKFEIHATEKALTVYGLRHEDPEVALRAVTAVLDLHTRYRHGDLDIFLSNLVEELRSDPTFDRIIIHREDYTAETAETESAEKEV